MGRWAIRTRMLAGVLAVIVPCVLVLIGVVAKQSNDDAKAAAYRYADVQAQQYADVVSSQIESARMSGERLAQALLGLKQAGVADRSAADRIQQQFLASSDNYFGVWTGWEPNTCDGRGIAFQNDSVRD